MKRRLTPPEKKALAYRHETDGNPGWNNKKVFRRYWPKSKARANQRYRGHVRQLLRGQLALKEPEINQIVPVRREIRRKVSGFSLRQKVARKRQWQVSSMLGPYFSSSYNSERHREKFDRFLSALMTNQQPSAADYAAAFRAMFAAPQPRDGHWPRHEHSCKFQGWCGYTGLRYLNWLRAFFADEPEWEARLRAWLASFDE